MKHSENVLAKSIEDHVAGNMLLPHLILYLTIVVKCHSSRLEAVSNMGHSEGEPTLTSSKVDSVC